MFVELLFFSGKGRALNVMRIVCLGLSVCFFGFVHAAVLTLDAAFYQDTAPRSFSLSDTLVARGNSSSSMVYDGQGRTVFFSAVASPIIIVNAGKSLTLKNVTLVGLIPEHISLRSATSKFFLGDGVVMSLERDLDVNTTLTFSGNVTLNGRGKVIEFSNNAAFCVVDNSSLCIRDCRLKGMRDFKTYGGANASRLMCSRTKGQLILDSVKCCLDASWSFTSGALNIWGDVGFTSSWATFTYVSGTPLTIVQNSSLLFDGGITFAFASRAGPNKLIFADASSTLVIKNSTLRVASQGLNLATGALFIKGDTLFKSDGVSSGSGITLDGSLYSSLLSGASLSIDGILSHGKPA